MPPIRFLQVRSNAPLHRGAKDSFGLVLVREGWFDLRHRGRTEREHTGAIRVIERGEVYLETQRSPEARLELVLLSNDLFASVPAHGHAPAMSPSERTRTLLRFLTVVRAGELGMQFDSALCDAVQAISGPRCDELRQPREALAVSRARELLLARFRENVRLDALAEHARLDKFHLVRAFRARHGLAPYEYLTHLRILEARRLLAVGMRAADVAARVGYCDQSQLHRHFVRIVGTSPGRYGAEQSR